MYCPNIFSFRKFNPIKETEKFKMLFNAITVHYEQQKNETF